MITTVSLKKLKSVVMDPSVLGDGESYFSITDEDTMENITIVNAGKNGSEFNKTLGFVNKFPGVVSYRCIYGHGVIVVQKSDEAGEAKEVKVLSLRPGIGVEIPYGYGHFIANIGKSFLVVVDNAPLDQKYRETEPIIKKRGFVYFIIDKKGDVGFEKNPQYSFHPLIST